jgi:hypothetical protein
LKRPLLRKLGDGGALFDPATWQTRILTPAAVVIVEALAEVGEIECPLPTSRALDYLRTELDIDTDSPEMQQVLRSLQEMGMLGR